MNLCEIVAVILIVVIVILGMSCGFLYYRVKGLEDEIKGKDVKINEMMECENKLVKCESKKTEIMNILKS